MLTVLISYLFDLLRCSWRQSRKTRGSLLEQLTELAEKDPSALKKLTALNDGTKQSVQLLPPVTLFQGARENRTEDFEVNTGKLPANSSISMQVHCDFMRSMIAVSWVAAPPWQGGMFEVVACCCKCYVHLVSNAALEGCYIVTMS